MQPRHALTAIVLNFGALASPAFGQTESIGSTAPAVYPDPPEYRATSVPLGGMSLTANANERIEYDSNVYASPTSPKDDVYSDTSARIGLESGPGPVTVSAEASGTLRRYASRTTEDSNRWRLGATTTWSPSPTSSLATQVLWQRAVEDRSDTEARTDPDAGPREFDILSAELRYHSRPGRLLLDFQTSATRVDALSAIDADRDFSTFNAQSLVGLRVGGVCFATASAFVSRREFRISRTTNGLERDTTTYGGRVGLDFEPGGVFEGSVGAGIFRYAPDEPTLPGRTGLSISAALIYRPSRRTALLLDAFNGDVATFRNGALGRTDTRVRLTLQQEIRHNLFATFSGGWRKSHFVGTSISENTASLSSEVEFVLGRHLSLSLNGDVAKRTSDSPDARFERFRGGLTLRAQF